MIKIYNYPAEKELLDAKLARRKNLYDRALITSISDIFSQVAQQGDNAIIELTKQFDQADLTSLIIDDAYINRCMASMPQPLIDAIHHARQNIEEVNEYLLGDRIRTTEIRPGTIIGEKISPLESVGLWVPARKAPLVSTALMLVGGAKVAGVKRIVVGMAPTAEGRADPVSVVAARLAGATDIVVGNGVGIIAGFSMGTETIPEVDGIFGPGPGGIAAAMSVAFSYGKKTVLGIGPTDSAIICDDTADPEILAYDMINEGEHGVDSASILVTTSMDVAQQTLDILTDLVDKAPESRKDILDSVFSENGMGTIVYCNSIAAALELIDDFAPEHMIIKCSKNNEQAVLEKVKNAGEILIGNYAPFTAGNYAIGITAVLPTNGFARNISGITAKDMVKVSTIGELTKEALAELLPTIREIGRAEGLPSHVSAVEKRFH